jgi:hypothetical protein
MKKFLKSLDYDDIAVLLMAIFFGVMVIGSAISFAKWLIVGGC